MGLYCYKFVGSFATLLVVGVMPDKISASTYGGGGFRPCQNDDGDPEINSG